LQCQPNYLRYKPFFNAAIKAVVIILIAIIIINAVVIQIIAVVATTGTLVTHINNVATQEFGFGLDLCLDFYSSLL
jgi:hypothetical protein